MAKPEKIHFVTGKLAAPALQEIVEELASSVGFEYTIQILPITVAALLTPDWIAARIKIPGNTTRIVLPGYAMGNLKPIQCLTDATVEFGPKDLRQLPVFFGKKSYPVDLSKYDIEIIAEINHAPRMTRREILAMADELKRDGADWIDLGCDPESAWSGISDCVKALVDEGFRVSIDSFNASEIAAGVRAGAELVLSVNFTNREQSLDWGCEVVVVPDTISDYTTMNTTIELLQSANVPFRIDPILEPIGFGFAKSLRRYMDARARWPDFEMMMGVGNLTELSDVDSAGINFTLLAICQELKIRSVLTTQVINWARSSVKECDISRRVLRHAIKKRIPPKHLSTQLTVLRDPELLEHGNGQLAELAAQIRDHNYRIFAEDGMVHLIGGGLHLTAADPFDVYDQLAATNPENLNPSHAFYLGYEMCKALTALTLGKQYSQDEALNWGHLTRPENDRHRISKRKNRSKK